MLEHKNRIHNRYAIKSSGHFMPLTIADGLFSGQTDFSIPANTRNSLSSLLIVHPIAAFFNLVCLALAIAAHFHSPSHSARYLLGLLILLLPTLLVTLLAFLVDILLFVPHLQWGGWIVLASTILITAAGVVTCAMRRTLVARKARKRRIAENAEMSGENFYNRQNAETMMKPMDSEPRPPLVNGAPGADNLPNHATYDASRRSNDDDRTPLNQGHSSALKGSTLVAETPTTDGSERYGPPRSRSQGSQGRYDGQRDQYGNPIVAAAAVSHETQLAGRSGGMYREASDPGARQSTSDDERMQGMGTPRGGYGPPRGRGGYPPGSYGSRGGARGGSRGSYGGRGPPPQSYHNRGGYAGDPRFYNGRGRGSAGPMMAAGGAGMAAGGMMGRGSRGPPPGYPQSQPLDERDQIYEQYGNQPGIEPQQDQYVAYGSRGQSPARSRRDPSPAPPLPGPYDQISPIEAPGQAVEMDALNGTQPTMQNSGYIAGNTAYRQPQSNMPATGSRRPSLNRDPSSEYSQKQQ